MRIRQLEPKDAKAYYSLRLEALQNHPDSFGSSFEEESTQTAQRYEESFATPTHIFTFGAFEGDELVGMITLVKESLLKLSHRANIVAMYVKPNKRGSGIAKALLNTAIEKARSLDGVEQIYLTVVTTNTPAKNLYLSFDFKAFGYEKHALKYQGTYYDEEHMVLFI